MDLYNFIDLIKLSNPNRMLVLLQFRLQENSTKTIKNVISNTKEDITLLVDADVVRFDLDKSSK